MKIKFEYVDDYVLFRVYDYDAKYQNVLELCFYDKDDYGYFKRYPRSVKYLDKIMNRYLNNAQHMFDQVGYFSEIHWEDVLIEPIVSTNGWVTKDFGVLFTNVRIDIASDPSPVLDNPKPVDCGPYALEHLETVIWRGHSILVPPLELQLYVNQKRGRIDRANKIEAFMKNHNQL